MPTSISTTLRASVACHLTDGAGLTTLSGHDFVGLAAPVPEPEVWASLLAGAFALIGARRRRSLALRAAG